ncbi:Gfo/Idh/MocA family protein [Syntrophaceticus schinkii]|jgi:predicted dehydrogenase|uniref:Oxidoreductase domain protein n=1 Tax=Syntrophaceticus schinkii TaxID=499207 RepID=A0A0B7MIG2_9FIRM|nr:Gfo/Idh/MocA family oxidoreductase [Syntrophaceticus schinkii]CEO87726.1 Oxidoreductase domain protein [Syntrophaceticus schinkii]
MKFFVVGLGSMGKRRIRCLKALGYDEITGYDPRKDRQDEAKQKYNIDTIDTLEELVIDNIHAVVISTPPDKHNQWIKWALDNRKPCFIEASVIKDGLEELNQIAKGNGILIAPSCTLTFHPAIKDIKEIVKSGCYGKITNFSYHSGQYLPDWHTYEDVKDYYVSQRETGGTREIVPFELTWLVELMGLPTDVKCFYGETMDVGASIDDTYVIALNFNDNIYGSLIVDVASRYATRSLILNMEKGQIVWRWDDGVVKVYDAINMRWVYYNTPQGETTAGYNKNIIEDMYIDEVKSFIDAVKGVKAFPNTLHEDIQILNILYQAERG